MLAFLTRLLVPGVFQGLKHFNLNRQTGKMAAGKS